MANKIISPRRDRMRSKGISLGEIGDPGYLIARHNRFRTYGVSLGKPPVFLMNFDGVDESTTFLAGGSWKNLVTITSAGETEIDTAQYKSGTSSVTFDWNQDSIRYSDYIKIAGLPNFTRYSFTLSLDVRLRWLRNFQIVIREDYTGGFYLPNIVVDTNNMRMTNTSQNQAALVTPALVNTWYHIDQTNDNGTLKTYLNKVLKNTATGFTTAVVGDTMNLYLAYGGPASDNYPFSGWMDNLKIYDYAKII